MFVEAEKKQLGKYIISSFFKKNRPFKNTIYKFTGIETLIRSLDMALSIHQATEGNLMWVCSLF